MMVVLKLPVVYLCAVVLWAIRAEPKPLEEVALDGTTEPDPVKPTAPGCGWADSHRGRSPRRGPRGGRARAVPNLVHSRRKP